MEATIQQQDNRIFNIVMAVVAAILMLCAAMAWHNANYRATITNTTTMQWTSDTTSWTGGWR